MREIADRLESGAAVAVTVLPDGSVDRRSAVVDADGDTLSRERLAEAIADGAKTFLTTGHGVEAGGQSVNAGRQLSALGAETTVIGHLDHPQFESLSFRTYSMGDPAEIHVYELADGVTMFATESTDIETWTVDRLHETVGPDADRVLGSRAILWTNWAAFPHGTAAIADLAAAVDSDQVFALDPGAVSTRPLTDAAALLDGLAAQDVAGELIVSPNGEEADRLAAAIDVPSGDHSVTAAALRSHTGADAVVIHERARAIAATADGVTTVPTVEDLEPTRHAGAGDAFSAGITYARALAWPWPDALTLANACAAHYLVHGRTGDRDDLQGLLSNRGQN
ncbi:MAG: PfkB family carbohydrate kinase [Halanaeroarchaeum sp.]